MLVPEGVDRHIWIVRVRDSRPNFGIRALVVENDVLFVQVRIIELGACDDLVNASGKRLPRRYSETDRNLLCNDIVVR